MSLSRELHVELKHHGATVLGRVEVICVCSQRFQKNYNDVHVGGSWVSKRSFSAGVVRGESMLHSFSPNVLWSSPITITFLYPSYYRIRKGLEPSTQRLSGGVFRKLWCRFRRDLIETTRRRLECSALHSLISIFPNRSPLPFRGSDIYCRPSHPDGPYFQDYDQALSAPRSQATCRKELTEFLR